MNIFINDVHILLLPDTIKEESVLYDEVFIMPNADVNYEDLKGNVCIKNASDLLVNVLISALKQYVSGKLKSITFMVADVKRTGSLIKKQFKILKAGGGVVHKKSRLLMLYRLNKWDLPKGKREKGEKLKQTAIREVAEECNIKVTAQDKICTTWHFYNLNGTDILKKTNWYMMECENDFLMKPQQSEGIEQLIWMNKKEITKALKNSYTTINYVMGCYYAFKQQTLLKAKAK